MADDIEIAGRDVLGAQQLFDFGSKSHEIERGPVHARKAKDRQGNDDGRRVATRDELASDVHHSFGERIRARGLASLRLPVKGDEDRIPTGGARPHEDDPMLVLRIDQIVSCMVRTGRLPSEPHDPLCHRTGIGTAGGRCRPLTERTIERRIRLEYRGRQRPPVAPRPEQSHQKPTDRPLRQFHAPARAVSKWTW
jgi:hypothetical protein